MKVALLTAAMDPHYSLGLAPTLVEAAVDVELVGNSEMEEFHGIRHQNMKFFNLMGDQRAESALFDKIRRVVVYYPRILDFSRHSRSDLFHII